MEDAVEDALSMQNGYNAYLAGASRNWSAE